MSRLQTFQVFPNLPEPLSFLEVLSRNLWWCWQREAADLFRRIDPRLWDKAERNPITFLTYIPQERLDEIAMDDGFLAHQQRVREHFNNLISAPQRSPESPFGKDGTIAYFSMEYGIHESLPLFAGGLGVLAGCYLKAASDLALPLTGVGILYRQGYFHQFLDHDGWQQEEYPEADFYHLPLERAKDHSGNEVTVSVSGPDGEIHAAVWKVMVGRVILYLLDTNIPENPSPIRDITSRLYAGGQRIRLAQEVLLGIGGIRALKALGICPTVCHMNEGHSAFSGVERLALAISDYNINLKTALEIIPRTTVFTTHTPVAAGHDVFPPDLVRPFLFPLQERLGAKVDEILSWGQPGGVGSDGSFSMFVLGLRMAQYCNGVSRLHGKVARRMWSHVWPGRPEDEVPISHITNGIHIPTWISHENALLFERYLGPDWHTQLLSSNLSERIDEIYDEELWLAHEMSRSRLIRTCRDQMVKQYKRRNAPRFMMEDVGSALDQDVLTIAFARRFTTYKRASLLFHDPERLKAIINSKSHPVQFIFAGKAHPKDHEGKELIKRIVQFASEPSVRHRIIFLEEYDMHIARHLVQGADVWLNTPRRPFEACGTSGMKAAANGALNTSVLDGWWCEGYSSERGWRISGREEYADAAYQDAVESQALYNVLENNVIPCFYEAGKGDASDRWIKMMKESMKMAMRSFSSHRMVDDYYKRFYVAGVERLHSLVANDAAEAKSLMKQRERLRIHWKSIRIDPPVRQTEGPFRVGESFCVTSDVYLNMFRPEEVQVQLCFGHLRSIEELATSTKEEMTVEKTLGGGHYRYICTVTCRDSGRYGFTVRITPRGDDYTKFTPGLITWA